MVSCWLTLSLDHASFWRRCDPRHHPGTHRTLGAQVGFASGGGWRGELSKLQVVSLPRQ